MENKELKHTPGPWAWQKFGGAPRLVETEEIIIQNNTDNDGWENASTRLYNQAKAAIKKAIE